MRSLPGCRSGSAPDAVPCVASPARRRFGARAGAVGLSLLLPACRPDAPPERAPDMPSGSTAGALRFDLRHRRQGDVDAFTVEALRRERHGFARPEKFLRMPDWGDYRLSLHGRNDAALLFRCGFDTGVDPGARSATSRLSVRCPMPDRASRAVIERRHRESGFHAVSEFDIDPASEHIDRAAPAVAARVEAILESGPPGTKANIAILGDGYREAEYPKFAADARRAAGYLFAVQPFARRMADFNVYAVFAASTDSGITDPYLGLKKDTVFRSAYGSGGAERVLADGHPRAVREAASAAPYDFVLILANARRYGGSAVFGGPAVAAIDSAAARYLVVHEFAHVFGGLADEYYVPAGNGLVYTAGFEPWHPNVTRSPDRAKWHDRRSAPAGATPWNKAEYDRYFAGYVRRYEALRAAGAAEAEIDAFLETGSRQQQLLLAKNPNPRDVGCFEGAGGYARGLYRAEVNCIMYSMQTDYFCAACTAAIERMLDAHVGARRSA